MSSIISFFHVNQVFWSYADERSYMVHSIDQQNNTLKLWECGSWPLNFINTQAISLATKLISKEWKQQRASMNTQWIDLPKLEQVTNNF